MSANQILPVNNQITASGSGQKANGIVQTQSPQSTGAFVLCDSGVVYINGAVEFSPPQPVADASKIFSPDLSSQIQCQNGGTIQVTGTINGYSTTAQTNQAIGIATADFVTQTFLEDNYYDTTETQIFVQNSIDELSTVYMPIGQTLDQIPLAENTVNLNNQKIDGLADPNDLQQAVNLQYLQNNYTDTTQSELYVGNAISQLSNVYQSINTTLNNIPLPENEVDMNSYKIVNLLAGTQPTDAVNLSQLDGYIPVTGNINSLTAQTANYDTSGFQLTVSNAPSANNDLTNKLYVDGQISGLSTVYQSLSGMVDYISSTQLTNILSDYVLTSFLTANYYTQTYINNTFQTLAGMSNYVLGSFLTANYYTQTYINNTFQTIASMSNFITVTVFNNTLANYVTQTLLDFQLLGYVMTGYLQTNYTDNPTLQQLYATKQYVLDNLSLYVTSSSLATTLTGYITSAQLAAFNYLPISSIGSYTQRIQTNTSTGTRSQVDCQQSSEILFNVADVQKMRIYTPAGQTPNQPTGIEVPQKLQIVTAENSVSINGSKAIQTGQQNGTGLYVKTPYSASEALFTQVCVQPSSANCQNLTMSSGQINIPGLGMTQYSTLCNGADGVQQNLQISAALPNQGDQTLNLYSNSYATAIGQVLTAQFTGRVGYSSTITITQANQFTSKTYVDTAISGLSSVYQTISGMSSYYTKTAVDSLISGLSSVYLSISSFNTEIANYYTKIQADGLFVLQTTPLNDLAVPTGDLAMEGFEIKGLQLIPSIASSAASKSYVDSQIAGGGLTKAVADTYYYSFANTNLPTQSLNMNTQKIINLATPTTGTDATTKTYVDTRTRMKTGTINIGTYTNSTTPVAVTGFTGFITGATKQVGANSTLTSVIVNITFSNPGFTPYFIITGQADSNPNNLIATGLSAYVFSSTTTSASFVLVSPAGDRSSQSAVNFRATIMLVPQDLNS